MNLEFLILTNLIENEDFTRKVLPYIKEEYFRNKHEKLIFKLINSYVASYNTLPSKEALYIELSNTAGLSQDVYENAKDAIGHLHSTESVDGQWLVDQAEDFCQDRALNNALLKSVEIVENKPETKGKIPEILTEALGVSFDTDIGHSYFDNWEDRYAFYTSTTTKKPFSLDMFNKITGGGIEAKTLTVALAGTHVGKSRWMCHEAATDVHRGRNVLYITMEMAEMKIAERLDANLLDVPMSDLKYLNKDDYKRRLDMIRSTGKLIVKEYPTSMPSVLNFKHLLNELRLKQNFSPDVIYIDYINICASSRMKKGQSNSYEYIKAISEEMRGLAVEMKVPIITATQTNRHGFTSSDLGLEDTAESFGLPATADFMFALISTEELTELDQQLVKQLKNRFGDPTKYNKFVIGLDRSKMRYYDVEDSAQTVADKPVMDNTDIGQKFNENKFEGFF